MDLAKVRAIVEHPRPVRAHPGEERGAARVAQRKLAVRAFEEHPFGRQPIDVWRTDHGVAVTMQIAVEIVNGNEEDVLLCLGRDQRIDSDQCQASGNKRTYKRHDHFLIQAGTVQACLRGSVEGLGAGIASSTEYDHHYVSAERRHGVGWQQLNLQRFATFATKLLKKIIAPAPQDNGTTGPMPHKRR